MQAAFAHAGGLRMSWLGAAVAAEVASLAAAHRLLLFAAGVSRPWRTVSGMVIASTGLARVMSARPVARWLPAGPEYRRRGRVVGCAGWRIHLHGRRLGTAAGRGRAVAGTGSLALISAAVGMLGRRHGRAYRSGAPRQLAQPVAEPASSPLRAAQRSSLPGVMSFFVISPSTGPGPLGGR